MHEDHAHETFRRPPPPGSGSGAPQPAMPNPLVSYWKQVVLEHYAKFAGRSRRAEFWWYFLANVIISVVFNILDAASVRASSGCCI